MRNAELGPEAVARVNNPTWQHGKDSVVHHVVNLQRWRTCVVLVNKPLTLFEQQIFLTVIPNGLVECQCGTTLHDDEIFSPALL